jgi:hypothetical protein
MGRVAVEYLRDLPEAGLPEMFVKRLEESRGALARFRPRAVYAHIGG